MMMRTWKCLSFVSSSICLLRVLPTLDFKLVRAFWKLARIPYAKSEVFRFYGGPIDGTDRLDYRIGEWKINEAYIEQDDPTMKLGIINDTANYPELTAELLIERNRVGADTNITLGFHVVEFLLWGIDSTAPDELETGMRSFKDFVGDETPEGIYQVKKIEIPQTLCSAIGGRFTDSK